MALLTRQYIAVLTSSDNNKPNSQFSVASVDAAGRDRVSSMSCWYT